MPARAGARRVRQPSRTSPPTCWSASAARSARPSDLVEVARPRRGRRRANGQAERRRPGRRHEHPGAGRDHQDGRGRRRRRCTRLLPEANACGRTEQPASKLCLAMECGGSDGNSGVTANPALGRRGRPARRAGRDGRPRRDDRDLRRRAPADPPGREPRGRREAGRADQVVGVVRRGLRRRAEQQPVARQQGRRPDDDLREVARGPGQGGLDARWSTWSAIAERVDKPGLVFMDTPGFDPICTTGLVAGGANVLVFTTGRGSVLGLKPTPCIKVATNTPMYERMIDDMDINAGTDPRRGVGRGRRPAALRADPRGRRRRARPRARPPGSARRSSPLGSSARSSEAGGAGRGRSAPSWLVLIVAGRRWKSPGSAGSCSSPCRTPASPAANGLAGSNLPDPGRARGRPGRAASASRTSGMALDELSHVENLPQRLPIVLAAALIAASAIALGRPDPPGACGSRPALDRWERLARRLRPGDDRPRAWSP